MSELDMFVLVVALFFGYVLIGSVLAILTSNDDDDDKPKRLDDNGKLKDEYEFVPYE